MAKSDSVTEALLEMYFHHAMIELFEATFGARALQIWKPSTNGEAHFGYDQGWVRTRPQETESLKKALKVAIANGHGQVDLMYFGYFMQYKVVEEMRHRSCHMPDGMEPVYYRSAIDTRRNGTTGRSQHETLIRLSRIKGADVSYACGMIFDADAIWDPPNLDLLRIVPVDKNVEEDFQNWKDNEPHFICFQSQQDLQPIWKSEPVVGRSVSLRKWVSVDKVRSAEQILKLLEECERELRGPAEEQEPWIPITVIEFSRETKR